MTICHRKPNVLFILICFYHPGVPLQTRDLCSRHCKNSLEMCLERLRWVSGYILALIAKEHTVKPLNNVFTDVQLDAREQNWSLCLKMLAAALQWWKMLAFIIHMADLLAEHQFHNHSSCPVKDLLSRWPQFSTGTWAAQERKAVEVGEGELFGAKGVCNATLNRTERE